jgi:hypothetical protein
MNEYVAFPGEQALVAPGTFERTRFFYFVLKAERDKLEALCERYLRGPSGRPYSPVGVVVLGFTHVDGLTSSMDRDHGTITYKDIALWVPVMGGHLNPVCLFPPFIFVDDGATMVTGREVYGLPKQLGRFQMPLTLDELAGAPAPQFRAEAIGTLHEGGQNDWRTLFTVESIPGKITRESPAIQAIESALLGAIVTKGWSLPKWLSDTAMVPAVGLKQMRDAASQGMAAHQEVVEAPLQMVELFTQPRFFVDAFKLTLMDVPSHPIASVLGLPAGESVVPLTIHFEATMEMGPGTIIGAKS